VNPVIEYGHVRVSRTRTGTESEGNFGVIFGNTADSFFVTEGITEDEVWLLLIANFAQNTFHVTGVTNVFGVGVFNFALIGSFLQGCVDDTIPGFFNGGGESAKDLQRANGFGNCGNNDFHGFFNDSGDLNFDHFWRGCRRGRACGQGYHQYSYDSDNTKQLFRHKTPPNLSWITLVCWVVNEQARVLWTTSLRRIVGIKNLILLLKEQLDEVVVD
jgi:hypothetical protein